MSTRRPAAVAITLVLAVAAALLVFQPLLSPWWTGGDADSVYVGSATSLMGGRPTRYYDHPGTPLQEALGATLEARWALVGRGSRRTSADTTFRNLDRTRPYFRGWALLFYFGSLTTVIVVVALLAGSWLAGALSGLLFLGAPDVLQYAIEFRPDVILGAIAIAIGGLLVGALRRRSAPLYLAAAGLLGAGITVKLHTAGMLLPFAIAVLLAPPEADWAVHAHRDAAVFLRRHRVGVVAASSVYISLVVLLNLGSASSPRYRVVSFVAATAAIVVLSGVVALVLRRSRVRALGTLVPALIVAAMLGAVLPNLFYAGTIPTMARWVVLALIGRGVNSDAQPLTNGVGAVLPWAPYALLAAVGAIRGIAARDRETYVWTAATIAMGALAAARFGTPHYFIPAVAVATPLILRGIMGVGARPALTAVVATVLLLVVPFRDGIRSARHLDHQRALERTETAWALGHLRSNEAALSTLGGTDATYVSFILPFTYGAPTWRFRVLPADVFGTRTAAQEHLRIRYVLQDPREPVDLSPLGLVETATPKSAPAGVEAVARQ